MNTSRTKQLHKAQVSSDLFMRAFKTTAPQRHGITSVILITNLPRTSCGKREKKNQDWFKSEIVKTEPVIRIEGAAQLEHKTQPTVKILVEYHQTCTNV